MMTRRSLAATALAIAVLAATTTHADIRVVDEAGEPIAGANVLVIQESQFSFQQLLTADDMGIAGTSSLGRVSNDPCRIRVIATSPGMAWGVVSEETVSDPTTFEATVVIPKGREMRLELKAPDDRPIPEGSVPFVFDERTVGPIWWGIPHTAGHTSNYASFGSLTSVSANDDGTFSFRVPEEVDLPLYLGFSDRNYLMGWISPQPIDLAQEIVSFSLPAPGSAHMKLIVPEGVETGKLTATIVGSISLPESMTGVAIYVLSEELENPAEWEAIVDNLAPGRIFNVDLFAGTAQSRWNLPAQEAFNYRQSLTIEAGVTTEAIATYKKFDPDSLRGDAVAIVSMTRTDGSVAAREKWDLVVSDSSMQRPVPIDSGITDENGVARIDRLKLGDDAPSYSLMTVDGERIGKLKLTESGQELAFSMPPVVGDIAPDVTLVDMSTGENVKLSDYRGQVIFLDFWATWCGPCQEPMQHNSDLLKKRANDWNGKAAILAISCDDEIDTLEKHVTERGWDNIVNLWCEEGGTGWQAAAMRTYAINGVPTAFLIDKDGKILWRGHPSGFDLEGRINALIGG